VEYFFNHKNEQLNQLIVENILKLLLLSAFLLTVNFSGIAQDSIKIKNRHNLPDTTPDTGKLDGGALIDTIHTTDSIPSDEKTDTTSQIDMNTQDVYAMLQDDRQAKLADVEKDIIALKAGMKKSDDVSTRSALASIENKKNELKARLKNGLSESKEIEKWNAELAELKVKIEKLKSK
jgi:hypothetical protein